MKEPNCWSLKDRIVEDNNEEIEQEENHNHSQEKDNIGARSRVSVGGLPRNNSFDMRIIEKQTSVQGCKMGRKSNCVSCEIAIPLSKSNCDCEKLWFSHFELENHSKTWILQWVD